LDIVRAHSYFRDLALTGSANGTPALERLNPLDMPDDFFRIRIVCMVLDTCGICFDRGAAKKKLDFFLTFFQASALPPC